MNYRESVVMPTRKKAPQRNPLLHVIFFRKIAFHRKAAPFLGQKPFLDRFLGEGA